MNTDKTEREELTIWGAVGPNGQLVKSSVGTFKSVAARWALRRGNYEVVKLGVIPSPGKVEDEPEIAKSVAKVGRPVKEELRREPKSVSPVAGYRRRAVTEDTKQEMSADDLSAERGLDLESDKQPPRRFKVDPSFFGRTVKRK